MRYDIHFRDDVADMIQDVVGEIKDWNGAADSTYRSEIEDLAKKVVCFEHCSLPDHPFVMGGADGSGDFPCVKYGDSFVYLSVAMSRIYEAIPSGVMKEHEITDHEVVNFLWLPGDKAECKKKMKNGFSQIMGKPIESVCQGSDYFVYKKKHGKAPADEIGLIETLILPEAHDASNIEIQLLTVAEASSLVKLIESSELDKWKGMPVYLIEDTTMALPMVTAKSTLFFEVAKRYACVKAREKGITYMTLSKSHNMPHMDLIEDEIAKTNPSGEHWFLRIPCPKLGDGKKPEFLGTRTIPPVAAVSYLFKLHKTTQPMRLDLDYDYWKEFIQCDDKDEERRREIQLFRDIDFASHDQRCYGYPYPIKACHDMASMTDDERVSMRKQIIDEAIKAGLKRKNFVDPSIQTGHA